MASVSDECDLYDRSFLLSFEKKGKKKVLLKEHIPLGLKPYYYETREELSEFVKQYDFLNLPHDIWDYGGIELHSDISILMCPNRLLKKDRPVNSPSDHPVYEDRRHWHLDFLIVGIPKSDPTGNTCLLVRFRDGAIFESPTDAVNGGYGYGSAKKKEQYRPSTHTVGDKRKRQENPLQGEKGRSNYRHYLRLTNKKTLHTLYEGTNVPKTYKYGDLLTIYMKSSPKKILPSSRMFNNGNSIECLMENPKIKNSQNDRFSKKRYITEEEPEIPEIVDSSKRGDLPLCPKEDLFCEYGDLSFDQNEGWEIFMENRDGHLLKVQMKRNDDGSWLVTKDTYELSGLGFHFECPKNESEGQSSVRQLCF